MITVVIRKMITMKFRDLLDTGSKYWISRLLTVICLLMRMIFTQVLMVNCAIFVYYSM
jgi:hypothetical protein